MSEVCHCYIDQVVTFRETFGALKVCSVDAVGANNGLAKALLSALFLFRIFDCYV